ncbi:MAG: histidine--tRNA ligase [Bacteroidetes bacterium]|nr:histidine--tRNA ligase [Bacteroidota bacterium]
MSKVSLAKGTRDFGAEEMRKRKFIFNGIEQVFQLYGFHAIETPALENIETLTGKYGDEGDQLLFKILDSGDFWGNIEQEYGANKEIGKLNSKNIASKIASRGLRYDLTVPFARYVSMNRHLVKLPFRRYQMQPVWRADRPQKGRYREFWQCDADIIGSNSLLCEADLMGIFHRSFEKLGIKNFVIHLNSRKILEGVAEVLNASEKFGDLTIALDKYDKIGIQGVKTELQQRGFDDEQIEKISHFLFCESLNIKTLEKWKTLLSDSKIGLTGVSELGSLLSYLEASGFNNQIVLDGTLARGLSYYTGCIFEVKVPDSGIGSIAAGGRYDNLTGIFGMPGISGVGISFGADRIYDLMEAQNLFPKSADGNCKVLFCGMDENAISYCIPMAEKLRNAQIACKIYPEASKLKKQLDYANAEKIPYAAIIGEQEMKDKQLTIKDLETGKQETLYLEDLINKLKL